jgi:hypothetical protein
VAHRRLAELPVDVFVTTNFDTLLERAVRERERSVRVLTLADAAEWIQIHESPAECVVLKIHGCIAVTPIRLIVTEDDYLSFTTEHETLVAGLTAILARRPILFVGYSLSDWNLLSILDNVRRMSAGSSMKKYFVGIDIEHSMQKFLEQRHGLDVFNLATETSKEQALLRFLDALVAHFNVPEWFRHILFDLGGRSVHDIAQSTPLDGLASAFDIVARMRLATKIERQKRIRLPMDKVVRCVTIGDLLQLVEDCECQ